MRWIYLTVIVVFVAVILIFVFQNLGVVTMAFLGFAVRAPLSIVAAVMYVLGALTGGSLYALLRKSVHESRAGHAG
jgi:lipopolysaccharide assembly protein A